MIEPVGLSADDRAWLDNHFREQIFPILTPLAIDPAHPFPFVPNLGFVMALRLTQQARDAKAMTALIPRARASSGAFVRIARCRRQSVRFVTLENVIGLYLDKIFLGYAVNASGAFRILRDSDIDEIEEEAKPRIWSASSKPC